jgi:hypothetical protein
MTGAFEAVFLAAGCLSLAVLAIDWRVSDDHAVRARPA